MNATVTTWLLTYLVHSTVLLGTAWLASHILGEKQLGLQEALLRVALIGGIVTASLQVGFGFMPLTGAFSMDSIRLPEVASAAITADVPGRIAAATTADEFQAEWAGALLALWIAGSLMALIGLGRSVLDLRRLLQTRRLQPAGRLLERLAIAMGLGKKVRFSTSAAIAVPFATGISRPEICCPERVKDLAIEHRTALFAHELAHISRRDPAWQLLYRIGEAFLFPQPLNRLVRRRLEEIAEHLTDERAVSCTGNRLGLARCLVVIAHWGTAAPLGVPSAAFAAGPRLDQRVRRLISGSVGSHRCAPWTVPLVITLLLGFAVVLPLIAPTKLDADQARKGTEVAPVRTWSLAMDDPRSDVPQAPEPPAAPAAAGAIPPVGTAPTPETAPTPRTAPTPEDPPDPESAPPASPAPLSAPAPVLAPQPPIVPETTPRNHERAAEDERDRQRAVARERSDEAARTRERARALTREAVRQDQNLEARREEFRQQALAMRVQAESEHREMARAARELSRTLAERARETAARVERLTDEQREEFRRRADQYRAEARERSQEAARLSRERARALAEEARILAEEAETRRLAEEERRHEPEPN